MDGDIFSIDAEVVENGLKIVVVGGNLKNNYFMVVEIQFLYLDSSGKFQSLGKDYIKNVDFFSVKLIGNSYYFFLL